MATGQVLTMIAILLISFITGFIFFYGMSPLAKNDKKKQLDELASLIINFIIYIWLSKVLLNISLLVKDPLAVLAYPSNAQAFYLATLFLIMNLVYKKVQQGFKVTPIYTTFVPVFLVASFVYEFIQIVWVQNAYSWIYLVLLMILVVVYALFHDQVNLLVLSSGLMLTWVVGKLALTFMLPFTAVFGYLMAPWYLILLGVLQIGFIIYQRKRGEL